MSVSPAVLYGELLEEPPAQARLRCDDGRLLPHALERWLGPTTAADEAVAEAAVGPVLDVGCGPGRLLDAFARRGKWALGVDLSPIAVSLARRRGRRAVLGCVFEDVPGAGEWATALLLDGNIGIGGDPAALLRRVAALLRPGGLAVAEVESPGAGTREGRVRLESGETTSHWFPWAHVDVDGVAAVAAEAGLSVQHTMSVEERWFAWLG